MSETKIFEVVSYFGKLLATENIKIQLVSAPTAMFDTNKRVLYIPVFAETNKELASFLVAHEVGHALFTPADFKKPSELYGMILNCIEDYRVDLAMFDKYRGLPIVYKKGVEILNQRDFYGADTNYYNNVVKDSFLERLNMFLVQERTDTNRYKVSFNNFEKELVRQCQTVCTFEDVKKVSLAVEKYLLDPDQQQQPQPSPDPDGDQEEGDDQKNGSDGSGEGNQQSSGGAGEYDNKEDTSAKDKASERKRLTEMLRQKMQNLQHQVEHQNRRSLHFDIPACSVTMLRLKENQGSKPQESIKNLAKNIYKSFIAKRTASKYSAVKQYTTGEINSNVLYDYKCRDEVFLSKDIVKGDTNHSLIFYLDVSGSMSYIFEDVKKSLKTLIEFCTLASIHYQVWTIGDCSLANIECIDMRKPESKKTDFSLRRGSTLLFDSSTNRQLVYTLLNELHCDGGNTPLEGHLLSSLPFALEFNKKNNVERCRAIVLTDGGGNQHISPSDWMRDTFVYNAVNGKYYEIDYGTWDNQSFIFDTVESYLNANLIWMYNTSDTRIVDKRQINVSNEDLYNNPKIFIKTMTDRIA